MGSIWVWRGEKMDRAEGDRRWGRVVREYLRQTAWEASVLDDSNQGLLTLMRWWRREIIFARLDERGVPPGGGNAIHPNSVNRPRRVDGGGIVTMRGTDGTATGQTATGRILLAGRLLVEGGRGGG